MVSVYELGYLGNYWRLAPKPVDMQNSIFDQYYRTASQLQFPSNYTTELPLVRVQGRARRGISHCPRELGNDHFLMDGAGTYAVLRGFQVGTEFKYISKN